MEEVGLGFEVSLDNNKKRVINCVCVCGGGADTLLLERGCTYTIVY